SAKIERDRAFRFEIGIAESNETRRSEAAVKCAETLIQRRHTIAVANVSTKFRPGRSHKVRSCSVECVRRGRVGQRHACVRRVHEAETWFVQSENLCTHAACKL